MHKHLTNTCPCVRVQPGPLQTIQVQPAVDFALIPPRIRSEQDCVLSMKVESSRVLTMQSLCHPCTDGAESAFVVLGLPFPLHIGPDKAAAPAKPDIQSTNDIFSTLMAASDMDVSGIALKRG